MQSNGNGVFASLEQLKSKVWDTREEGLKELKKAGFRETTAHYRLATTDAGRWYIEETDPDASQDVPEAVSAKPAAKAPNAAKAQRAAKGGGGKKKPAAVVVPNPAPARASAAKSAIAKDATTKAAPSAKPAKPAGKLNKSSDPSPSELPAGFDDWLVEQASSPDGVLRTEINKKLGVERRWQHHLRALAEQRGYKSSMQRDGRFTRFRMTKET